MNKKDFDLSEAIYGILLILVIALVPVIVHVAVIPTSSVELEFIRNDKQITDLFSYYKSVALCVITVLVLINIGLEFLTTMKFDLSIFKSNFVRLMLAYIALIILSTIFSPYKELALNGAGERYEGMWVLLSYAILSIAAFMFVKTKRQLNYIFLGILISVLVVGGIGLFQYFGMDFFKTDFAARVILGKSYQGKALNVKFTEVYSTLYNPDCVGLYTTLLLPLLASAAIFLKCKNPIKYAAAILFAVLFICLVGSDTVGGMIGFIASAAFVIILMIVYFALNYKNIKNAKIFAAVMIAIALCLICVCAFVPQVKNKIIETYEAFVNPPTNERFEYRDYKIEGNKGIIETAYGNIEIVYDNESKKAQVTMPMESNVTCTHGIDTNNEFYKSVTENGRTALIETVLGNIQVTYTGESDEPFIITGLYGEEIKPQVSKNDSTIICDFDVADYGEVKLSINSGSIVLNDSYGSLAFIYENNILKEVQDYSYDNNGIGDSSEVRNLTLKIIPYDDNLTLNSWVNNKTTKRFEFVYKDGGLKAVTKKGEVVDLNEEIPSMIFKNEYFATGRGFIWSRSIPLMLKAETFFTGSGADTFAVVFPQEDMAAKVRTHGNPDIIVDKPHNLFIQTSVNTGLVSLIVLLAIFVFYIVSTIKAIFTDKSAELIIFATRIGILGGVIGYLVTGLTTDSVISVAPVFWVMLGVGFAVNKIKSN